MRLYKYVKVFGNFTQSDVKKLYENKLSIVSKSNIPLCTKEDNSSHQTK